MEVAQRLDHLPAGADVQRGELELRRAALLGGLAHKPHGGRDDLTQLVGAVVQRVGAEGVGEHEIAARGIVGAVDILDDLRMGERPLFTTLGTAHAPGVQQRAHASVQQQQIVAQIGKNLH